MPAFVFALLLAAALGGSAALMAQSSLPGDVLWGFKTTVNENILGAAAQDDKAKADWDISIASTRLDEALQLAKNGKLDTAAQEAILANFNARAKDLAERVAKLKAAGKLHEAADVAARFQAGVAQLATDVRENAFTTAETDIEPFLANLRDKLEEAAGLSAGITI